MVTKAVSKPVQTEKRVAAYLRVSTEEQADSHLGLDAQLKRIRGKIASNDWQEPTIYTDDGVSGTIDISERPDGARLLADIESKKINVVVVSSVDRIGRNVYHVLKFIEQTNNRIELVSCKENMDTTTAIGKAMLQMALVFAELETSMTSERTIAALDARGDKYGIKAGIPPYGYRYDTTIVKTGKYIKRDFHGVLIVEQEAEIVRYVYLLRGQGLTLRAIADKIEAETGTHIGFNTVKNILDREEVYRGGKRGESEHTWPIILNVA